MKTKQLVLTTVLCVLCTAVQSQSLSVPELLKYLEKRSPAIERKLKKKGFNVRTYVTREGYAVLFGEKRLTNNKQIEKLLEEKKKKERFTFQYEITGSRALIPEYIRQIEREGFAKQGSTRRRYHTIYYKKIDVSSYQPKQLEIIVLDDGSEFVLYFKRRVVRLKEVRGDEFYRRRLCNCGASDVLNFSWVMGTWRKMKASISRRR